MDSIAAFRKLFEDNKFLEEFDREIFETVIDKILVGKIDEDGVVIHIQLHLCLRLASK